MNSKFVRAGKYIKSFKDPGCEKTRDSVTGKYFKFVCGLFPLSELVALNFNSRYGIFVAA